jgi:16S rRNA (guanine966-N2)-methyltransferase
MTGLRVLDLFAGTGSLGIEALSRGALWALFIDHSKQAIQLIMKNLMVCGYQASGHILKRDLTSSLPWEHPLMRERIDLIFIDPPYGKDLILSVLSKLSRKEILKPSTVVVTESSKTDLLPSMIGQFQLYDTRLYGETKIEIYHCGESK